MKKVYMPSMDMLYQMQDMEANIYKYLVIKKIESIICEGVGTLGGILSRCTLNEIVDMKEYQEIVKTICLLYPEELKNLVRIEEDGFSKNLKLDLLKEDVDFCLQLLYNSPSGTENNLDYLTYFNSDVTSNVLVLKKVFIMLREELTKNPKYRFEYLSDDRNNTLLDDVFECKIGDNELMFIGGDSRDEIVKALTTIEPAYAVSLCADYLPHVNEDISRNNLLYNGINAMANRYRINRGMGFEYFGKDILTNPDSEVKKLVKNIK